MEPSSAEGRRAERLAHPPLMLSGLRAIVHDISASGICIHTSEQLQPGERLELMLTDAEVFHSAELCAEVRWIRRDQVGLQFVELDRQQREWLAARLANWHASGAGKTGMTKRMDGVSWSW